MKTIQTDSEVNLSKSLGKYLGKDFDWKEDGDTELHHFLDSLAVFELAGALRTSINVEIEDEMLNFTEEFIEDKRCHPILPGVLLLIFLLGVASFISHMESIPYFDAFYACFITYSTIGFGDIDIYVRYNLPSNC